MPDINRDINIEDVNYTIEMNKLSDFVVELNEQGPQGARGYTGNGIESYVKTSTVGLTDIYTITFTDGNTTTVGVENGRGIVDISLTSSVGNIDTYTITYNDNTTSTFNVVNGIDGQSAEIVSATASIDSNTGTPSIDLTVGGTPLARTFEFAFHNLKGEKGEQGDVGPQGEVGPQGPQGIQGIQGIQGEQGIQGIQGPKGDTGDAFNIYKTYSSIADMEADASNVPEGKFVLITSTTEDPDNSKLYVKNNVGGFTYLTDMSGAQGIQGPKGDTGATGPQGPQGVQGEQGPTGPQGATGPIGISVTGVTLISTVGLVKTYRMSFSDGSYFDYTVTDGASGSTTWGNITGTLSNQTDLQNVLNAKQDVLTSENAGNCIKIAIGGSSGLPVEYQEVEYLQSSGTQYINTGAVLDDTMTIRIKYDFIRPGFVFGSRTSSSIRYSGITNESNGSYNIRYGNEVIYTQNTTPSDTVDVVISPNGVTLNGAVVETTAYGNNFYAGNCYLFTINSNGSPTTGQYAINRIRRFTIDNVIDLVPCKRKSDDVLGMYDLINDEFLSNAGTGTFIAGEDIEEITKISFVNDAGFISGITSLDVTTALGYTPYNATNPNGYISSAAISSLTDVNLTSVANNQALLYNSTTQKWENKDVTVTVDSALDNTSTNPVENRVIAQALEGISLAKNPNLNIIGGSLNIDSGNVSGFSTTDYMQFPFVFNFNGYHWTLEMGITTGSNVTTQQNILDSYYGIAFAIRNGKFVLAISSNGSSWDIANVEGTYSVQANTAYSVKIAWDGTNYTLSYALDETNYTTDITVASTPVHHSTQEYVGGEPDLYGDSSQHPFAGTINLNNWKLIVNSLEVWLGMDDVGLGSRANIDLSNLTEAGQYMVDTVKDQNDGSRIKTWTGTKAQYEAIVTKDSTTLYFLTDVGKIYFGDTLISNVGSNNLLDFKWTDGLLYDTSWLRADTFSWQDGTVYQAVYDLLWFDYTSTGGSETETIGSYTVTFYKGYDGRKICLADQEQTVLNIYNDYGIAWYYILDTENTRFKLPRTKYGFEGLRTNVGDMIDESLPNITGEGISFVSSSTAPSTGTGAIRSTYDDSANINPGSYWNNRTLTIDASRSSSTYQDNAPVQERATQMYLYFYVGDYSQTAIEQTAGLNSELFNGKVDLNASNLNAQGMSYIAGLGMPSSTYIDLTLGASGSTYTAPANGWFFLNITRSGTNGRIYMETSIYGVKATPEYGGATMQAILPIKKNNVITVGYDAYTNATFRFIYAQGSESEAQ